MNEIILELAALLLASFCLIYSVTTRRELYLPLPSGALPKIKSRHFAYLGMLAALCVSAAASVGASLMQTFRLGRGALMAVNMAYFLFHNLLPFFFALYFVDLCGPAQKRGGGFFLITALPMLAAQLLTASNLLTGWVFFIDEMQVYHRGGGIWMLYAAAAVYMVVGMAYFACFHRELAAGDSVSALILIAVSVSGTAVQAVFSVPVELFFESVAFFGFMVLMEHDAEVSREGMSHRFRGSAVVVVLLIFVAVILVNVSLIRRLNSKQSDKIGNIRLDVIRSDLEDTIDEAENNILRVHLGAEQLMDENASREELLAYFSAQKERLLASPGFMNLFIAGPDWHVIPDFEAPPEFHASERIWYLGAREHPNEVFITEPYLDADTGAMCFTVSSLLHDGETVVGLDLNFSKAQESILNMTEGTDHTAMIVTSGGLIAGYTDMSLVGERADERLPEFKEVLRRVTASHEHGSFEITLDGRGCMIFSSETSNGWYLILIADTGVLYAEAYREMALMAAVDLLMLVIVLVFYLVGVRSRRHTAMTLSANRRFVEGFAEKLRHAVMQVMLLADTQVLRGDPEAVAEQIKRSGAQLNELAASVQSYSDIMQEQALQAQERAEARSRRRAASAEAPSRKARQRVVITLLFAMVIVLILCFLSTAGIGNLRMQRVADSYESQLDQWLTQQRGILYMTTDLISAEPALMEDYPAAVRLLADITDNYPEISACYMANPYAEHPVVMNTGWEPGEDYRPETRPWYKAAQRSTDHFSISAPYIDAQTGTYCVTLSRVVYGQKGEFLGIFGIDFFLDKLISLLGESYTHNGYAFLVDSDGDIINHPNPAYQMSGDNTVSIEDTEYAGVCDSEDIKTLRDYSGRYYSCLSRRMESGFTMVVAFHWWSMYGSVALVTAMVMVLFGFCILVIELLINRLIRWQGSVNRQLVESAEAAMQAGRAKSQFLAQMSHEIRTPMNAIIGLDNIALHNPDLPARTREELEKIGASARHLLGLINDILDMSRIESGRMVLKEDEFSFRDFLSQVTVIINGQCEDKGLRFECSASGPIDDFFIGDDLKLKQVLINILGNSVKFTDPPGMVSLTVEQVQKTDDACVLRFKMKDTGIGMDKEFIPKLFEAFSQEDATNTNRYGGSGLGMAITKNIVEMMGGEISVESEKGLGSIFTVTVPLKPGQNRAVPAAEAQPAQDISLAGLHVLIAEDNEINAEILTDLLDMEEITSEWAENGQIAVDTFAQSEPGHFDAVLMDVRMPVMDGLAAARALRSLSRPDAQRIPIVALTANAFEENVQQCLEAGMDAHLSKPVDIDLLKATLARLLAERG